ncbi:MAG: DUF1552 domain-containing protein [Polyangiales bacterium]
MDRRAFLGGIGGVVLALPFLESLAPKVALADSVQRRFVCFFECNGVNMDTFFPPTFGPLSAASFPDTCALRSLRSYASRLLIPRGIATAPAGYGDDSAITQGCDHKKGMAHKLTSQPINGDYASGISVDHEMAKSLNAAGVGPLTASVGPKGNDVLGVISYRGANLPVPGQNNPKILLDSLGLATADDPTKAMVAARRKSVLDLVGQDMESLKRKGLSAADKQKLDMHFTTLRSAELATAGLTCGLPPALLSATSALNAGTLTDDAQYKAVGRLQMDVITLALACGRNNVATLLWGQGSRGPTFKWDGMNFNVNHHKISHGGSESVPGFMSMLTQVDSWYCDQFRYLLDKMDAYVEGTGTLLDNSAVLWINELSDGDFHDYHDLPIVIAGGCGGRLKTGQYVNMTSDTPKDNTDSHGNFKGKRIYSRSARHNKLLTTLLNAVGATSGGAPYTRFGHPSLEAGEFTQLRV